MVEVGRCRAILALLDVRHEGLPELAGRAAAASSGFVHRAWVAVACADCLANGRVLRACETCGGRGSVEVWRSRDPYASDVVTPFGFEPANRDDVRERDRLISALEAQTAAPGSEADLLAAANAHPYGWERERERLYAVYDLAVLERALEEWRGFAPGVSPYGRRGVEFLDARLPVPLRAPSGGRGRGMVRLVGRDVAIRRAVRAGRKVQAVAEDFGLSASRVYEIVNGPSS